MSIIKDIWCSVAASYSNDVNLIQKLLVEIEQAYAVEDRFYHNMHHIEYMIQQALEYKAHIIDFDVLLFSIVYHDMVYDVQKKDNELKSAELAVDRLSQLGLSQDKIDKCYQQIISTQYHKLSEDADINLLLDFDLAILGQSPDKYNAYSKNVRKEYAMFSDFEYLSGREQVLFALLKQKRIFKTHIYYNLYEKQARINLNAELQSLSV